jgi:hypothetical protein
MLPFSTCNLIEFEMTAKYLKTTINCVGEVGRLLAELERSQRLELELRRQLKDRERVLEDLQQETEKRVGQIQVRCTELSILTHALIYCETRLKRTARDRRFLFVITG